MLSTDRKLELKAKTSMAKTASQAAVYAKGLTLGTLNGHMNKLQSIELLLLCRIYLTERQQSVQGSTQPECRKTGGVEEIYVHKRVILKWITEIEWKCVWIEFTLFKISSRSWVFNP
jgi:hypothetical protein